MIAPIPAVPSVKTQAILHIPIEGMCCASCADRVEQAIQSAPGTWAVSVDLATSLAKITIDSGFSDTASIADAIFGAGYMPGSAKTRLAIRNMTCSACAGRVRRALGAATGVLKVDVNLATETAIVDAVATTPVAALISAVANAGYIAVPADDLCANKNVERPRKATVVYGLRQLLIAGAFSLPLILPSMARWFGAVLGSFDRNQREAVRPLKR